MTENSSDSIKDLNETGEAKRDVLGEILAKKDSLYQKQKIIFALSVIAFVVVLFHIILDVFLQNPNLP